MAQINHDHLAHVQILLSNPSIIHPQKCEEDIEKREWFQKIQPPNLTDHSLLVVQIVVAELSEQADKSLKILIIINFLNFFLLKIVKNVFPLIY